MCVCSVLVLISESGVVVAQKQLVTFKLNLSPFSVLFPFSWTIIIVSHSLFAVFICPVTLWFSSTDSVGLLKQKMNEVVASGAASCLICYSAVKRANPVSLHMDVSTAIVYIHTYIRTYVRMYVTWKRGTYSVHVPFRLVCFLLECYQQSLAVTVWCHWLAS